MFRIRRDAVDLDAERTRSRTDGVSEYDLLGEQVEWGYAIPLMYRVLASPTDNLPMPPAPTVERTPGELGYWVPLLHLMLYSLGWAHPARGLRWWYDQGKPALDPHLALMGEMWDRDGQLDWFAAWLWDGPLTSPMQLRMPGEPASPEPVSVDREWLAAQRASADTARVEAPCASGGYDPLHLSMHCTGPLNRPPRRAITHTVQGEQRIWISSAVGWYRALNEVDNVAGEVPVVVDTLGPVGTFHRSPDTGRWVATSDDIHRAGS